MRKFLKKWILPISMLGGVLCHDWIENVIFITPYLIFVMLVITYSRVSPKEFKITRFHVVLLLVQMIGCWVVYFATYRINPMIAEGGFICVFISTATAAPVITGMLGGSVTRLATYSLLSNLMFACLAPFFLPWVNSEVQINYVDAYRRIGVEVFPMLILPIITVLSIRYGAPKIHNAIEKYESISFYIWTVALFIVVGSSVNFIIRQSVDEIPIMIGLAAISLVVCCAQFYVGRKIGGACSNDPVAGGQGLGQKNTILAIWIALTYLNPISSVAPASYVLWQNIINTWQLYRKRRE